MKHRIHLATLCLVSFFAANVTAQAKPQDAALERLRQARIFALGPVGFAGTISHEEIDFRLILSQPNAIVLLEKLYSEGDMEAKAYALTGMQQLFAREKFDELYAALPGSDVKVNTMRGCIVWQETLRNVAKNLAFSIDSGK